MTFDNFDVGLQLLLGMLSGAAVMFALLWPRLRQGLRQKSRAANHEFIFHNGEIVSASPLARAALSLEALDENPRDALIARLCQVFPDLKSRGSLELGKIGNLTMSTVIESGPIDLEINSHGARERFTLSGLNAPLARHKLVDGDVLVTMEEELGQLRDVAKLSPMLIWRETQDGAIDWANRAYMRAASASSQAGAWPPPKLFSAGPITSRGESMQARRAFFEGDSGQSEVFDIYSCAAETSILHYAISAQQAAAAEQAHRQLTQTLTQTFASLSTGLMVFDRDRKLVMFNPALVDLTTLPPDWLSARPPLFDVLNQMRERRITPERKNFAQWREEMMTLEKSAVDGSYFETWTLPSGQTYRMTGKPYPAGAIAFLLEDVSAEVLSMRKFRKELTLNQAVLDQLGHAVAVFDSQGVLCLSNEAYDTLWCRDPEAVTASLTISEASNTWKDLAVPSPIWAEIRDFVLNTRDRSEWTDQIQMNDGRGISCHIVPLSGANTLVEFQIEQDNQSLTGPVPSLAASAK